MTNKPMYLLKKHALIRNLVLVHYFSVCYNLI